MKKIIAFFSAAALLSGCVSSPSIPILGAFFPAWLLCSIGAIVITLIFRAVLIKCELSEKLGPPLLVYPLITVICTLSFWILFFRN